jgi:hypothetical protein
MINGRRVILCFHFQTGDALGMNMAYKATDVVGKNDSGFRRPRGVLAAFESHNDQENYG